VGEYRHYCKPSVVIASRAMNAAQLCLSASAAFFRQAKRECEMPNGSFSRTAALQLLNRLCNEPMAASMTLQCSF
jgi:hypothetical protein